MRSLFDPSFSGTSRPLFLHLQQRPGELAIVLCLLGKGKEKLPVLLCLLLLLLQGQL
jgi:hypothetical protein